jgi:gluconate 2-dehydrogenase gamma chain
MLTRRELIRLLGGASAALAVLPACGDNAGDAIFTSDELNMLRGFADAIIPEDDTPGGTRLGAVEYIEGLLTAFDQLRPAIFAGGPFSDRNPLPDGSGSQNDFTAFVELDRVAVAAWRPYVAELRAQLKAGLTDAAAGYTPLDLSVEDFARIFDAQPDDFRSLMIDLVTEAAFAAPEYGGNRGLAGWKMIHFEGDSLPRGYSQWDGTTHVERPEAPLTTANPSDPEPMTAEVHDLIKLVISVLGGRVRP